MRKGIKILVFVVVCILLLQHFNLLAKTNNTSNNLVMKYQRYVKKLSVRDINSIKLALNESKKYMTKNKRQNDGIFRTFYSFFENVQYNISEDFNKGKLKLEEKDLNKYGIRIGFSESGDFLDEKPDFIYTNFANVVSAGLKRYLEILNKEMKQTRTYVIEDMGLSISWNELADRIIAWEQFSKDFSDYPEAKDAKSKKDFCLYIYIASYLDNTPLFLNGKLTDDTKASYERFVTKYSNSSSFDLIQGYYQILKENDFVLNQKAIDYLKSNKIDTEQLENYLNREGNGE